MRYLLSLVCVLVFVLESGSAQYINSQRFSGVYRVDQFPGGTLDAKLQACVSSMNSVLGGICDARSLGNSTLTSNITVAIANVAIYLPCATITTAYKVIVAAGVRNTRIEGCSYQGGSASSGTSGGTVWIYTGSGVAFQIGDTTYAANTKGFLMSNINLNTASAGTAAKGLAFYRTQEIDLRNVYLNGDQLTGQTGIFLDGTGNYTGGTFDSDTLNGFGTGVYLTGHLSGSVVGDFANASTFTRLHIVCPTSSGSPISGTYGVNIVAGDGNTWNGGDIESCSTMFHLGANAINNTVVGLRNENSTIQYQADSGSSFNAVFTGGTFYTGKLVDNGSRNSFWDAFHHTVNGMKGDWYASQQDATVINHLRLGIGTGTVRGMQWESQVDVGITSSQYNWLWGLTDGASGESDWVFDDLINGVTRLELQEGNSAGSNGSSLNATGTSVVSFNSSSGSSTGGVAFGSGGASPTTVATIDGSGDTQIGGYLGFFTDNATDWMWECASATSCSLRNTIATTPANVFTAYSNGQTNLNSQGSSAVAINNTSTGGTGGLYIYQGGSNYSTKIATFSSPSAIRFPGLAASSGSSCLSIDDSGYVSNTGKACGKGSGDGTITSFTASSDSWPSWLVPTVTNSTTSPSLSVTATAESANSFLSGPSSGSATTPSWRALVAADLPSNITSSTSGNAATATKLASNTLGCLDGWDHLPCTVYVQSVVSESSPSASYATVYTTSAAGLYRVTGYLYGTTASTTSFTVGMYAQTLQVSQPATKSELIQSWQIGTSLSGNNGYADVFYLASGTAIQTETATISGSNTGGAWNRAVTIERLQ
jgi:hypothetical protein